MMSISQIEFAPESHWGDYIDIPLWMRVSADDSDNDAMPVLSQSAFTITIGIQYLRGIPGELEGAVDEILDHVRDKFGTTSFNRLKDEVLRYIEKRGMTKYGKLYIPDPPSPTIH